MVNALPSKCPIDKAIKLFAPTHRMSKMIRLSQRMTFIVHCLINDIWFNVGAFLSNRLSYVALDDKNKKDTILCRGIVIATIVAVNGFNKKSTLFEKASWKRTFDSGNVEEHRYL